MKWFTVFSALIYASVAHAQYSYPPTKKIEVTDTYFGKTYRDPYRWLESLKDQAVQAWFKAQAVLTDETLAKIPAREALAKEWLALDKLQPARYQWMHGEHDRLFYKKTLAGENVGKVYYRDGWHGAEKLLFDPQTFKPKGAKAADVTTIQDIDPSPDGRYVVLAFSAAGAEYSELRVYDIAGGRLLPESIYPSIAPRTWTEDSKSFFYDAGPVTDPQRLDFKLNRQTKLHRLGTDVASDRDVFSNQSYPDLGIAPKEIPSAWVNESTPEYIIGSIRTVQSELHVLYAPIAPLAAAGKLDWKPLMTAADQIVRGFEFNKDKVYGITPRGAAKYQLVSTSLAHPDWQHAEVVIPEATDSIQAITKSKSYLFVTYSDGITSRVVKYDFASGKVTLIKLPATGLVNVNCPDWRSNRCIFSISGWIRPTTLYDFEADKGTFSKSVFNSDVVYPGFDQLVTEEVEAPGHDGTMIPLSIIHRKDMKLDGSNSTILSGYGAYGTSLRPSFSIMNSVALHGVVLAIAHPRGGSEKGEAWYRAGYKTTKPNTWKDFISCGEYLIKKGYTSANKLAGTGTSAGGVLISRAITERPDLFAAAVCNVGCANTMRLEFTPNGPVNTPEFGTVKDATEVLALYEMDGFQHVKPGVKYPAVLGVGGWNDPRVSVWQPGKFVAALQADSTSGKPVLMKINYDNGHFTEEKTVTYANFAGQMAFMLWQTGHPEFQPKN